MRDRPEAARGTRWAGPTLVSRASAARSGTQKRNGRSCGRVRCARSDAHRRPARSAKECRRRARRGVGGDRALPRYSYSHVKQRRSSFPPRVAAPGFSLSSRPSGWIERQQHPSPALAGPGRWVLTHGAQPILRNSCLRFFVPEHSPAPGSLSFPSFSASDPRARGMAERREAVSFIPSRAESRDDMFAKRGPSRATGTAPRGAPP